jgi:hypothetical protein
VSLNVKKLAARLFRRFAPTKSLTPPASGRARLSLTALEPRDVPATLTVTTLSDATEGGANGVFRVTRDRSTASWPSRSNYISR